MSEKMLNLAFGIIVAIFIAGGLAIVVVFWQAVLGVDRRPRGPTIFTKDRNAGREEMLHRNEWDGRRAMEKLAKEKCPTCLQTTDFANRVVCVSDEGRKYIECEDY